MAIYSNTLKNNLAKNLANAYLVVNEHASIQAEERDLIKQAFNCDEKHFFYMDNYFKANEVEEIINAGNLLGSTDMIELLVPGDLSKTAAATIQDLTIKALAKDIKVLASCFTVKTSAKYYKDLDELLTVVRFSNKIQLNTWIEMRASKFGLNIDMEVANHIAMRTDNNFDMAAQELEKMLIVYGTKEVITLAKIRQNIADQSIDKVETFKKYLLTGKTGAMMRSLRYLKNTSSSPALVVWMLAEIAKAIKGGKNYFLPLYLKYDNDFIAAEKRVDKKLINTFISGISQADLITKGMAGKQDPWVYVARLSYAFSCYLSNSKLPSKQLFNE